MCSASDAAGPALFPLAGFDPTKDESWGARGFEEALSLARQGDAGSRPVRLEIAGGPAASIYPGNQIGRASCRERV